MNLFLQIDPPSGFNPATDSTLALALEAQVRGGKVFYYTPRDLSCENGVVTAWARPTQFFDHETEFFTEGEPERVVLEAAADIILVRQDPPYDMAYLTATWLLGMLKKPRVINAPRALREWPEKILPLSFPQFCPPTLISACLEDLRVFQREQGAVVLKPLYGHGGNGVFLIGEDGRNLEALLEMFFARSPEPVILQKFLPEVAREEKRILLVNGEVAGAFGRIPASGEIRSNLRVGGQPVTTTLSKREREICEAIGPLCKDEGILLAGVDVIGDWLTEMNITSPTGIRTVKRLGGPDVAKIFWDAVSC